MTHVSDILHCQKCPRFGWDLYHKKGIHEKYFHMIAPFSALWKKYLKVEDAVSGQTGDSNADTLKKMADCDVIVFARFSYRECRTQIPVLIKKEKGYHAIYPYLNCNPKDTETLRMKLDERIALTQGISIISHEIVYINKDYVRSDDLEVEKLFERGSKFFNRRNNPAKDIQECLDAMDIDLDAMINETLGILQGEQPSLKRNKTCTAGRRCLYYDECFEDQELPDDSIVFLTTSQHKLNAFEQGCVHIRDMEPSLLEGYRLQYAQYMASLNGCFLDKAALSHWIDSVQYPISYLDFEWDTFGVPPYKGMKPFDVLCFQYSLHIEEEDHTLRHTDFFGTRDCRKDFIESLIDSLPKEGSILVYNMEGAEKLRLIQLGNQFPEYKDQLNAICERMIDLSKPFETGVYYENRMRGHYSLKSVLPVFTDEVSYQQLAIHDGLNAVSAYRTFEEADPSQKKKIRQDIRNYCRMDTYAEYVVFHGLKKKLEEEEDA